MISGLFALGLWFGTLGAVPPADDSRNRPNSQDYARYARTSAGDPARGQALFADLKRLGCARCHQVCGQGGQIGPELSDIGGKFDRDQLSEAVLEPSSQIVEGYHTSAFATSDGRVLTGIVREESAGELLMVEHRRQAPAHPDSGHRGTQDDEYFADA